MISKFIPRLLPFLIAILPVVQIAGHNPHQVSRDQIYLPIGFALGLAGLVTALLWLIRRDLDRATLAAAFVMIPLAFYGRLYEAVWKLGVSSEMATVHWILTPLVIVATAMSVRAMLRTRRNLQLLGDFLGIVALVMVIGFGREIINADWKTTKMTALNESTSHDNEKSGISRKVPIPEQIPPITVDLPRLPDVYYIILDGYLRGDVLDEVYGFDNSAFLNELRSKGFIIADESFSNYPSTFMSLASSLNMQYLTNEIDQLVEKYGVNTRQSSPFYTLIREPTVARIFQSKGYRYVTALTNWHGTEQSKYADIIFDHAPFLRSEFFDVLLRTTAFRSLTPSVADMHKFTLEKLKEIPEVKGPTFTFFHILMPHNPYVFDKDGNERANIPLSLQLKEKTGSWENKQAYLEQMMFLNRKISEIVDHILSASDVDPIIIIQGDHGSASTAYCGKSDSNKKIFGSGKNTSHMPPLPVERLAILNAIHAGDVVASRLYPSISPVNTFRLILSERFGESLSLLEDMSFFSWYSKPYPVKNVTEELRTKPLTQLLEEGKNRCLPN